MVNKIKKIFRDLTRIKFDKQNRKRLLNKNFSLLCSNCTGGCIYHSLGLKFNSPTINEYMSAKDFLKFLSDLDRYLNVIPMPIKSEKNYPVVKLDDLIIYCVHYTSADEFVEKWSERKTRINYNNLFIMMVERDGCSYEDILNFDKLPFKNKIIFVHKPMPEIKSSYYIPKTCVTEDGEDMVLPLTNFQGKFTGLRIIDKFDYVKFFNEGVLEK